jgi:hypothetical protein
MASCAVALEAQSSTPALGFETVARPGMTIGGLALPPDAQIDSVALGEEGQVAFIAHWLDGPLNSGERPALIAAVLTHRRVVAHAGEVLDGGKYLIAIAADSPVAINGLGQVAYVAWYSDRMEDAERGFKLGVFVEKRLGLSAPPASESLPAFTLTEDGEVVVKEPARQVSAPQTPKPPGFFDRVRVRPPNGFPVTIAPPPNRPQPQLRNPGQPAGHPTATVFPMNHRGQMLLPLNFKDGGFLLLLGTPR